jgi:hypothetical protein
VVAVVVMIVGVDVVMMIATMMMMIS